MDDYHKSPYIDADRNRAIDYELPEHIREAEARETPFGGE
jgi:hypothetical protein